MPERSASVDAGVLFHQCYGVDCILREVDLTVEIHESPVRFLVAVLLGSHMLLGHVGDLSADDTIPAEKRERVTTMAAPN
jgi:hypothetical protein